jgi:hypothetical protein
MLASIAARSRAISAPTVPCAGRLQRRRDESSERVLDVLLAQRQPAGDGHVAGHGAHGARSCSWRTRCSGRSAVSRKKLASMTTAARTAIAREIAGYSRTSTAAGSWPSTSSAAARSRPAPRPRSAAWCRERADVARPGVAAQTTAAGRVADRARAQQQGDVVDAREGPRRGRSAAAPTGGTLIGGRRAWATSTARGRRRGALALGCSLGFARGSRALRAGGI